MHLLLCIVGQDMAMAGLGMGRPATDDWKKYKNMMKRTAAVTADSNSMSIPPMISS